MLEIPFGIKVLNPLPVESKFFNSSGLPYVDTTEVTTEIPESIRYQGLTVFVVDTEYWFKDGVTDGDLVVKSLGVSSPITLNGSTLADLRTSGYATFGSIFLGDNAGFNANSATNSTFIGELAGYNSGDGNNSNFFGYRAGYNSDAASSNFFGQYAGDGASSAYYSNFFGLGAGLNATNASNSNLFGRYAGASFTGNNIGNNNIIIGTNISLPNASENAINLGGVLFGRNTYSTTTGDPSISPSPFGSIGIGVLPLNIAARLHLPAGTATAATAPLKLTSGTALTTPEDGAIEYHGSHLYFTIGSTRYQLDQQGGGSYTFSNGLTESAGAVTLGGALTGNVSITGNQTENVTFGSATYANALNSFSVFTDIAVTLGSGDIAGATTDRSSISLSPSQHIYTWNNAASSSLHQYFLKSDGHTFTVTGATRLLLGVSDTTFNLGSDATGDTYYRNSSGYFTRLPAGTNGHVLTLASGIPSWAAPTSGFANPMTTEGDLILATTGGTATRLAIGANTYVLTSNGTTASWQPASGGGGTWGSITGTLSSQTDLQSALDNKLFKAGDTYTTTTGNGLALTSSTVTSGNLVSFTNTGTAAASNTKTALFVGSSGPNATSTQTTYAARFSNTNTGTSSTNNAAEFTASGGSVNNAIHIAAGNLNIIEGNVIRWNNNDKHIGISSNIITLSTYAHTIFRNWNGTAYAERFRINNQDEKITSGSGFFTNLSLNFSPTSGTGTVDGHLVSGVINQTGGANGRVIGVRVRPTHTSTADFIAFDYNPVSGTPTADLSFRATQGNMLVPASSYHNYGTTSGSSGYGFRDNAGTMEFKNSAGSWTAFGSGGGIGGSTGSTDNSILRADGTGGVTLQSSGLIIDDNGDITWLSSLSGASRTFTAEGSASNIDLTFTAKGTGIVNITNSLRVASSINITNQTLSQLSDSPFSILGWGAYVAPSGSGNGSTLSIISGYGGTTGNNNAGDIYINTGLPNGSGTGGNIGLLTDDYVAPVSWQGMKRGIFIGNVNTAPTAGIANGVALFAEDSNSSSELYVTSESGAKVNISGLLEPVTETGTSFTLNETHRNKIVLCTNSGAITVTVNSGKAAGWNCMLVATNATGTISLTPSSTTINGTTATTAQFETLSIVHYGSENYLSKLG